MKIGIETSDGVFTLDDALADGQIDVTVPLIDNDWRRDLAGRDDTWLCWFEITDDGEIVIGAGKTGHTPTEDEVRQGGFVTVRPFSRKRREIPIATIRAGFGLYRSCFILPFRFL